MLTALTMPSPLPCSVDPKGLGHTFMVHGAACLKSTTKPNCTFTGGGAPPAKMFVIDVKDLLGSDWRVGGCACMYRTFDLKTAFVALPACC